MNLGFFTMPLHPPGSDVTETLSSDLEQLVTLDKLGFDEAWIGEHFTAIWENIPCPDLLIAQALPQTNRMKFGTGVTCMPNHNPFMIAHRIAQLDHMAKGRFLWGVGSGGFPGDFTVAGIDPKSGEHRTLTSDALDAVFDLWDNPKPGIRKHKHWTYTVPEPEDDIGLAVHMTPYQKPHPPIAVAGVTPKSETLVLAGERRWDPISIQIVPAHILKTHWDAVEEGAANAGHPDPSRASWRIAREIYVAETTAEARKDALAGTLTRDFRGYWQTLLPKSKMMDLLKIDPNMSDAEITPEYVLDNIWIVGSPDDVTAKLQKLSDDVGGFGTVLAMGHEWNPEDKWLHSMSLLAKEVLPRLNGSS